MAPARKVTFLEHLVPERRPAPQRDANRPVRSRGFDRALDGLMDLTAGEAQVLLVGDVGLASAK